MNENDLEMKYVIFKLKDIKKHLNDEQQEMFWHLFTIICESDQFDKIYAKIQKKLNR